MCNNAAPYKLITPDPAQNKGLFQAAVTCFWNNPYIGLISEFIHNRRFLN